MTNYILRESDDIVWLDEQSGGYPIIYTATQTMNMILSGIRGAKLGVWNSYDAAQGYLKSMNRSGAILGYEVYELNVNLSTVKAVDAYADAEFLLKNKFGPEQEWFAVDREDYMVVQTAGKRDKDVPPADFESEVAQGKVVLPGTPKE